MVWVGRSARRPGLLDLGPASSLRGDGGSLIAYVPKPGTTRVLETGTGETFDAATPYTCQLVAVGAGRVLYSCPKTDLDPGYYADPMVLDTATSAWSIPGPPSDDPSAEGRVFHGIGSWWIAAGISGYHYNDATEYLPYRTGGTPISPTYPPEPANLNHRALFTPLCHPLTYPLRERLAYSPPYAVTYLAKPGHQLTIQRCGSHTARTLSNCRKGCSAVHLAGGIVTWIEDRHAYAASGRHPNRIHLLPLPKTTSVLDLVHTGHTAYALGTRPKTHPQLYAAAIPR